MPKIVVEPNMRVNCEVDDFLWPWTESTPVLMQHGFMRNATFWNGWLPTLTQTRRVYRSELRGCGGSDVPPLDFQPTPETQLRDLLSVVDELELERFHFVGEGAGGVLGAVFATMHPDRVASLVLVNVPIAPASVVGHVFALGEPTWADAINKYGSAEWIRRTMQYRLDKGKESAELQDWIASESGKTPTHVAAGLSNCFKGVNLMPLLKEIDVPVFVMVGDKKQTAPGEAPDPDAEKKHATLLAQMQTMQREIPRAQLQVFDGITGAIYLLAGKRCAEEATKFWEGLEAKR